MPSQEAGPHFEVSAAGKLEITNAALATPNDINEIGSLRIGLIEVADDLLELSSGSNAFQHINRIAFRYREALGEAADEMAIDTLYMYGVRLQNAAHRMNELIASNDYPEMSQAIGEALDSVIALHGPTIMSTEVGRKLVRKAQDYSASPEERDQYREAVSKLLVHVLNSDLLGDDGAEQLLAINNELGAGPSPSQSTSLAHLANTNLITACARLIIPAMGTLVAGAIVYVVGTGLAASQPAAASVSAVATLADRVWLFFTTRPDLFYDLAAVAGADLSWLPSFLRWLELKRLDAVVNDALSKRTLLTK